MLFRSGDYISIKLKVCCDYKGDTFYTVIQGPQNLNYEKILGESYQRAKNEVIQQWHTSQITSRIVANNQPKAMAKKLERIRRSIDGIIKIENALEPKEEAITEVIQKPTYTKQKTIEYVETDASFGDQTKIYGRQTRIVSKNEKVL